MADRIWLSPPHLSGSELASLENVLDSNWIAPVGPALDSFEKALSKEVGSPYCLALNSATSALQLALRLMDIGPDDIVLIQSLTFCSSANVCIYLGAKPVFIDSEVETWNMDPDALRRAIEDIYRQGNGKRIKAIMPVHLYGMPAKLNELVSISKEYGIPIVEDAAESLGSQYCGQNTGTFGQAGVYSFNGNKIVTTSGGGALISANEAWMERALFLATQAREDAPHYEHSQIGYNFRLSNVLAGLGQAQLSVLPLRIQQRREVYNRYREYFKKWTDKGAELLFQEEGEEQFSNRWLSCLLIDPEKNNGLDNNHIRLRMEEANIECRPLWKPMHLQPVFENMDFYSKKAKVENMGSYKSVSEKLFSHGLCLPSGSNMSEIEWKRIETCLDEIFKDFF